VINSYSEFQPLKECVVGQGYPPDYFDFIKDSKIREPLQQIFVEIEEDFQNLIQTLNEFGVKVVRPGLINKELFQYTAMHDQAIMPPITPRDRQTVFGKHLVRVSDHSSFNPLIGHYRRQDPNHVIIPLGESANIMQGANASCIYRMGRDIWFDESEYLTLDQIQWLQKNVLSDPNYRFHDMKTDGHSDCVFAVLKPGVIISCFHDSGVAYSTDFPGWDVHRVYKPSVERFYQFRNDFHPGQRWWVPGLNNLDQFRFYVDNYLNHWVGAIHETVFDVNCLSIDTRHVIFACYNKEVFEYCERHDITPILCDIRHRFFFDGGTHCCTLDIHREGDMEDYL